MNKKIRKEMSNYYWYHSVDLGNNIVTDGDYDMSEYLDAYQFTTDMHGMKVLDVGRASGYFSFEFEKRGADVTATDLRSYLNWDFVGGDIEKQKREKAIEDPEQFSKQTIWGAFEFAKKIKESKVKSKYLNAYDLNPSEFDGEKFDLVFCGSITSHLRDPILVLEKMHSVVSPGGKCIIAAPIIKVLMEEKLPTMSLVGTVDSDRRSWWVMNPFCVEEMLKCANFSKIECAGEFNLRNKRVDLSVPHMIFHAESNK